MATPDDNRAPAPSDSPFPPSAESTPAAAAADRPMALRKVELSEAALRESAKRLEIVLAIITVAAAALELQGAEIDVDVAKALRRCAADPLSLEIERLAAFIGTVRA